MLQATVNKQTLDNLLRNFDKFEETLKFRKPITASLEILLDEIQLNFDQQGRQYGDKFGRKAWQPLAEATIDDRERQGYPGRRPILERTGKLRKGFRVASITDTEGKIRNSVPYAEIHQNGAVTSKGVVIPQRRIVGSTSKSQRAIGLVFANFIAGNLKRYFKLGR